MTEKFPLNRSNLIPLLIGAGLSYYFAPGVLSGLKLAGYVAFVAVVAETLRAAATKATIRSLNREFAKAGLDAFPTGKIQGSLAAQYRQHVGLIETDINLGKTMRDKKALRAARAYGAVKALVVSLAVVAATNTAANLAVTHFKL